MRPATWVALLIIAVSGGITPAAATERIAALNWGIAQTLIALDIEPVGVAGVPAYRRWVAAPELPPSTTDLGRRLAPNLDVLASLAPDRILMSGYQKRPRAHLERIAQTDKFRIYTNEHRPLERSLEVARELAQRYDRGRQLARMERDLERALERLNAAAEPGNSVYLVQFGDATHVRVFASNALLGNTLERSDLTNAWQGQSNSWGFAQVPISRLQEPADHLVILEPIPPQAQRMMANSPLWQALPPVENGAVHRLEPVWSFGGVPSATRFARILAKALNDGD